MAVMGWGFGVKKAVRCFLGFLMELLIAPSNPAGIFHKQER